MHIAELVAQWLTREPRLDRTRTRVSAQESRAWLAGRRAVAAVRHAREARRAVAKSGAPLHGGSRGDALIASDKERPVSTSVWRAPGDASRGFKIGEVQSRSERAGIAH